MFLRVSNLCKEFNHRPVLQGLSFETEPGELLGIVGPDGAGKTTLLRILAGVLAPSSGQVENSFTRARTGYLSQHFSLYPDLTVWENLQFFARLYGLDRNATESRGKHLLQWVGLWSVRDRLAAHLSGGMKQKLSLACALVHPADLMLLDEPTTAVDPISRQEFWELIMELLRQKSTLLLCTPYMDEAARCHRVALLHEGSLLALNTPSELRRRMKQPIFEIAVPGMAKSSLEQAAMRIPGALSAHAFGESIHVALDSALHEREVKEALQSTGISDPGVRQIEPSLEDIYIWMLSREARQ